MKIELLNINDSENKKKLCFINKQIYKKIINAKIKFSLEFIREKEFTLFFCALGNGKIAKYNATPRIEVPKKYSGEMFKKDSNERSFSKAK